jgi:hypothetical protein
VADDNVVFVCLVVVEVGVETERTEGAVVMGEGSDKVVSHGVPGVRSWQAQIFVLIQLKLDLAAPQSRAPRASSRTDI